MKPINHYRRIMNNYKFYNILSFRFNNFYKKRSLYNKDSTVSKAENVSSTEPKQTQPSNQSNTNNDEIIYHEHTNDEFITPDKLEYRRNHPNESLKFNIYGEENHMAVVDIHPNKSIRSGSSKVVYMTNGVEIESNVGGFMSGIKRMVGGSSVLFPEYKYSLNSGYGRVAFAEDMPSKIIPIRLGDHGGEIICQRGAFVCGTPDVEITFEMVKNLSVGVFGGEGLFVQKIKGGNDSTVLIKAGGSLIKKILRDGEKIKIRPGLIVMRQASVNFDIQYVGSIKNIVGAGSIFFATLTGPGEIYIQTMDIDSFISEVASKASNSNKNSALGILNSFVNKAGSDNSGDNK